MRFAVMFVTVLWFTTGAFAQTATPPSSPQTTPQAVPSTVGSAPVGHRQPKLSDLPPDLAEKQKSNAQQEDSRLRAMDIPDRRLRICSGC